MTERDETFKCLTCKHFHEVKFTFSNIHKMECLINKDVFKGLYLGNFKSIIEVQPYGNRHCKPDKREIETVYPDLTYCNQYEQKFSPVEKLSNEN